MNTHPHQRTARLVRQAFAAAALASSLFLVGCSDSPESLLAKAKESIEKNEPKAAEIHLKNLLQKGENAEARYLLGGINLANGDVAGAEKELRRAQEAGYDPARLVLPLADALLQLGRPAAVLDEAAKASPADARDKARLATLVARANLATGKLDAGKASFDAALAADPDHVAAKVGLIALRAGRGDLPGASAEIDAVLAKHPSDTDAMALKGDLEQAQGRGKEAREWFAKVAEANPKDRNSRIKLFTLDMAQRDLDGAQKHLDELKKLTGPAPLTMHLQALLQMQQGKVAPARDSIETALKGAPDYLPAMALGAEIYLRAGALEQAERLSRRVIERVPESTQGYRLLAATQMRMNAPDRALQTLQPVIDKGAKDPALFTLAGEAALRLNDPARSAGYFDKAIALDPADPRKKTGLAFAHIAGGERERGIAELEQISIANPSETQADYALVATHLRARQFDKALAAIERLEKKQPDSALVASLRGAALMGKGDGAGARKAYELALQRDAKYLPAINSLAALDVRDGKRDVARKRYTDLLEKDPKNVQAMLTLAQLIQRTSPRDDKKAPDEILALLKRAHDTDRSSIPATLALSGWYVGQNQAKDAIPLLQQGLATHPDNVQLLDALGTAYLRTEQDTLGMETLERVLRARPDNAMLQMRMGQLKLARNDIPGALANLRRAVELEPRAIEPRVALAAVLTRTGKGDEARAIASAMEKEAPKNPAGVVLEGDIAMAERKFPEAVAAFRKAVAIQKSPANQIKLHQAVRASGNTAEADAMLRSIIAERPDDLALRSYAGEYAIARGQWSAAVEHYKVIVGKQPANALALNNMAWALHEIKDPAAVAAAEKALAAAPNAPPVMDTAGVIFVKAGQTERGLDLLRRAVAASPKTPALRLHLAEALISTGDKSGARTELETLLQNTPQGPAADRARELQKQL